MKTALKRRSRQTSGLLSLIAVLVLQATVQPAGAQSTSAPPVPGSPAQGASPGEALAADLPPLPRAQEAIAAHVGVAAARDVRKAQVASGLALRVGPQEYTLRIDGAQRRDRLIDQRFQEWGATLERPLRGAEKRRIDEKLGQEGIDLAEVAVGDALHESARTLLRLWFGWMRAATTQALWQEQLEVLREQHRVTVRRAAAGDVPRQDLILAEASLAQADFSAQQASARTASALIELQQIFPAIPVPARPVILEPKPLSQDAAYWLNAVLSHNHELRLAQGEVRRRALIAERARAERSPDPTLGLRYGSERNSGDRIVGVFLSVPLSGDARRARSDEAEAQIAVASSREAALAQRLSVEVRSLASSARAAQVAAARAAEAAQGMRRSAELSGLGYQLGEGSLSDVLLARRLALDAELNARLARLDASESRYRLLLDAHELWDFD